MYQLQKKRKTKRFIMKKIVYIGNNLSAKTKYIPTLVTLSNLLIQEGHKIRIASSKKPARPRRGPFGVDKPNTRGASAKRHRYRSHAGRTPKTARP